MSASTYECCGTVHVTGPHKLIGNGTIGRCGVASLKADVTVEAGFEISHMLQPCQYLKSLPVACTGCLRYLSSTMSACMLSHPTKMIMD